MACYKLLAAMALLALAAGAAAQGQPSSSGVSDGQLLALVNKCDQAKLDSVSDADLEACFLSVDGATCSNPCRAAVAKAGAECLLSLVDLSAVGVTDPQDLQAIEALRATLKKC